MKGWIDWMVTFDLNENKWLIFCQNNSVKQLGINVLNTNEIKFIL